MHRRINSQFGVGIDAINVGMKSFRMSITEQQNLHTDSWEAAAQACCADSTAALHPAPNPYLLHLPPENSYKQANSS